MGGSRLGEHAVYPGTFAPVTPGHLDVIERARHLFARVTVLVAVNADKQLVGTLPERAIQLRRELPAGWGNVSVAAWAGLTVAFCRQHGAGVIIRGVRNRPGLLHEHQLAAMNEAMGITTLLLPAQPGLEAVSSTVLRELGTFPEFSRAECPSAGTRAGARGCGCSGRQPQQCRRPQQPGALPRLLCYAIAEKGLASMAGFGCQPFLASRTLSASARSSRTRAQLT
jgi:pantetheine-phosphate adenylyltransferase